MLKILGKILDYLEEGLIVIGFAVMAILNFANVVSRYFLHSSISFTEEVVIIIFVWMTMLGISVGYKRHAHLGMSFVTDRLSGAGAKIAVLFAVLCSLVLIGFMLWYGIEMVSNQMRLGGRTTALRLPTYVQGLAVPVGAVLMAVRTIQSAAEELFKKEET